MKNLPQIIPPKKNVPSMKGSTVNHPIQTAHQKTQPAEFTYSYNVRDTIFSQKLVMGISATCLVLSLLLVGASMNSNESITQAQVEAAIANQLALQKASQEDSMSGAMAGLIGEVSNLVKEMKTDNGKAVPAGAQPVLVNPPLLSFIPFPVPFFNNVHYAYPQAHAAPQRPAPYATQAVPPQQAAPSRPIQQAPASNHKAAQQHAPKTDLDRLMEETQAQYSNAFNQTVR